MPQISFKTRVKYKGQHYPALAPFDADEADVPELLAKGGTLIEAPEEKPKRGKKKAAEE